MLEQHLDVLVIDEVSMVSADLMVMHATSLERE
jgi:hypothetical protein